MDTIICSTSSSLPVEDQLHVAVAAYLARYKGHTRVHATTDLKAFITWCQAQGLQPLL